VHIETRHLGKGQRRQEYEDGQHEEHGHYKDEGLQHSHLAAETDLQVLVAVRNIVVVENWNHHIVEEWHHNQHANHIEEPVDSVGVHLRRNGHDGDRGQLTGHQGNGNGYRLHPLAAHQVLLRGVRTLGEESEVNSNGRGDAQHQGEYDVVRGVEDELGVGNHGGSGCQYGGVQEGRHFGTIPITGAPK